MTVKVGDPVRVTTTGVVGIVDTIVRTGAGTPIKVVLSTGPSYFDIATPFISELEPF